MLRCSLCSNKQMSGGSAQAAAASVGQRKSSSSLSAPARNRTAAGASNSSPVERSSASGTARQALERVLARDATRYALEPDGSMAAQAPGQHALHAPTFGQYVDRAHSAHSDAGARKSAPPKSSPPPLERERTRRSKHAREPDALARRSPEKQKVYCGNNKKARELLDGSERLGKPSQCIQKGFGAALHQPVHDVAAFLRKFDQPYEKIIDPQLWYKNSAPPPGIQRATLPMAFQKGWGAGTAALARKLRKAHAEHAR